LSATDRSAHRSVPYQINEPKSRKRPVDSRRAQRQRRARRQRPPRASRNPHLPQPDSKGPRQRCGQSPVPRDRHRPGAPGGYRWCSRSGSPPPSPPPLAEIGGGRVGGGPAGDLEDGGVRRSHGTECGPRPVLPVPSRAAPGRRHSPLRPGGQRRHWRTRGAAGRGARPQRRSTTTGPRARRSGAPWRHWARVTQ